MLCRSAHLPRLTTEMTRPHACAAFFSTMTPKVGTLSQLSQFGGVHGTAKGSARAGGSWRNRPLFRREGDVKFKNGAEAQRLIMEEVRRRDRDQPLFQQSFNNTLESLEQAFDRNPKYAFVAKQLVEPERLFHFRVAWLDDAGTLRMNRGFRCQYASTLGPYHGGLHFGQDVDLDMVKAMAFDLVISNSLSSTNIGAAAGGANFDPRNKSEAEIQRFCQSFMTELSKYIGPDLDLPSMGAGVGPVEIGYLYGQYKRVGTHMSKKSAGMLWGGRPLWSEAPGHGVVHFAERMLAEKGDSLSGKRCLITGSGKLALAVAEKLLTFGAVPITFSDSSGHIYEERGVDGSKLATIRQIKNDRSARIGRYIMASTTATYGSFGEIFNVPCDLVFPCSFPNEIDGAAASLLADNGCLGVIEGSTMPCTPDAARTFKRRGLYFAPSRATQAAGQIVNGMEMDYNPILTEAELDTRLRAAVDKTYHRILSTAAEFNCRGDLHKGADIAGFLKVANVMMLHGAV